jgi:hypothetical protein
MMDFVISEMIKNKREELENGLAMHSWHDLTPCIQLRLDMPTLHRATAPSGPDDVGDAPSSFHST